MSRVRVIENMINFAEFNGLTDTMTASIHPVVIYTMMDHYVRSAENSVIVGTLLGVRSANGKVVEIRNAFAIPHDRLDTYNKSMIDLLDNSEEVVVGWYTTSLDNEVICDYYTKEVTPNIPVTIRLDFQGRNPEDQFNIKTFSYRDGQYLPLERKMGFLPGDESCLKLFRENGGSDIELKSPLKELESDLRELKQKLIKISDYIKNNKERNVEIAKQIRDTLVLRCKKNIDDIKLSLELAMFTKKQVILSSTIRGQ